jgi:hypothetical protein
MYDSHTIKVVASPMSMNGLSGLPVLGFAHPYLYLNIPPKTHLKPAEVKRMARKLHEILTMWCQEVSHNEYDIGSDPNGWYWGNNLPDGEDKDKFGQTVRLLGLYMTAAALGYGLRFSY